MKTPLKRDIEAVDVNIDALEAIDKALEIDSKKAQYWRDRSKILKNLDRDEEALESENNATELDEAEDAS